MSSVTNVILHYCPLDPHSIKGHIGFSTLTGMALTQVNDAMEDQGVHFVSVTDKSLPRDWYGGSKCLEQDIAIGAFNRLNLEVLIEELREISWWRPERIQLIICEQDANRFRIINVFEDEHE